MRYFKWIQEHWGMLVIVGSGFWTFVVALWMAFAAPVIDEHIDSRITAWKNDSLNIIVDNHLRTKGGGFRGQLADTTKIPKDKLVSILGGIMVEEPNTQADIDYLFDEVDYLNNFNIFILSTLYQKYDYNGVTFYLTAQGDYKYLDMYKKLWDAAYNAADDCFYYYPSYGNGNRLKCD